MGKNPTYPLYASDFDMDTGSWPAAAVGVYIRLLNYEWVNKCLPFDTVDLARIARVDHGNFLKMWKSWIQSKFILIVGGCPENASIPLPFEPLPPNINGLVNSRMEKERQNKQNFLDSQREKGIKSGRARSNRGSTGVQPKGDLSSSFSSSTSYNFLTEVVKREVDEERWNAFVEVRIKKRAPLTEMAVKLLCQKLEALAQEPGQNMIAIMNQSIERSYTGLFRVEGGANGRAARSTTSQSTFEGETEATRNLGDGHAFPTDYEATGL